MARVIAVRQKGVAVEVAEVMRLWRAGERVKGVVDHRLAFVAEVQI